jgi:hypothetical protein
MENRNRKGICGKRAMGSLAIQEEMIKEVALEETEAALEEIMAALEENEAALEEIMAALEETEVALEETMVASEENEEASVIEVALEEAAVGLEEEMITIEEDLMEWTTEVITFKKEGSEVTAAVVFVEETKEEEIQAWAEAQEIIITVISIRMISQTKIPLGVIKINNRSMNLLSLLNSPLLSLLNLPTFNGALNKFQNRLLPSKLNKIKMKQVLGELLQRLINPLENLKNNQNLLFLLGMLLIRLQINQQNLRQEIQSLSDLILSQ